MSNETNSKKAKTLGRGDRRNRQREKDFHHRYLALCRSKNFPSLPEIVKPKQKGQVFVDVYGDRFKGSDWQLITDALRDDNSLQLVALRLRKNYTEVADGIVPYRLNKANETEPTPLLDKRLFKQLIDALTNFLKCNKVVKSFTLEGFPLMGLRLATLITGLHHNTFLNELNLSKSSIGDEGCEALCAELKFLPNLQTLNLTACQLTGRGCQAIADVIKFQKIQRYATSWELSLRYSDIEEDKLMGLRYLILSFNPAIGDTGLLELTDILKDDAWVREIHVRNCGLTDTGAQFLIECLNLNMAIEKFDIRDNVHISNDACHEILVKLGAKNVDDACDELAESKKSPKTFAELKEHCIYLETQLDTERNRNSQLKAMVDQLHLQLGDQVAQMNELHMELNELIKARNQLLEKVKLTESKPPKKPAGSLRKTQSEAFSLGNMATMEKLLATMSKSETVVNAGPSKSALKSAVPSTSRVIERSIGDGGDVNEKEEDDCCTKL